MPSKGISIGRDFAGRPDPRIDRAKKHRLGDIPVIAPCAVVCGADSWGEVEAFGEARKGRLKRFLALPNGIPSHDTFYRVFARVDPQPFGECVSEWMAGVCEAAGRRHIAVGGRAARSAPRGTFSGCLRLVSARAAGSRLILGRRAVADGSHEIAATPGLLRALDLKGAVVTVDAGCRKEIARPVRDRGGDYLPAVRGNRPHLHDAAYAVFGRACASDPAGAKHDGRESVGDAHGRHEGRHTAVVYDPRGLPPEWPDVAAVVLVGREREVKGVRAGTARYHVTSLRGTAAELAGLIRRHWAVENEWHWCPDVSFREDANETAAGRAGTNPGLVRRVAAPLLKQDTGKGSIKAKPLRAGWEDGYRLQVLQGFGED